MTSRGLLLIGVSALTLSIFGAAPALAQNGLREAYRTFIDAQNSGDARQLRRARGAFSDACQAAGLGSLEACIAAIESGGQRKGRGRGETEVQPEVEPQVEKRQGGRKPLVIRPEILDDIIVVKPDEEVEQPEDNSDKLRIELQRAVRQYEAAVSDAGEDYDDALARANRARSRIEDICGQLGIRNINRCVGQELTPFPDRPQVEPEEEPEQPEDNSDELRQELQRAVRQYESAVGQAGENYDDALARANRARGRIDDLCAQLGFRNIVRCIGQELTPFPERPAEPAEEPEEDNTATLKALLDREVRRYDQAVENAAEDYDRSLAAADRARGRIEEICKELKFRTVARCLGRDLQPFPDRPQPEEQEPDVDPLQAALEELKAAVSLYNEGVRDLTRGRAGGQGKVDRAERQIDRICESMGFTNVKRCLDSFDLELAPLPREEEPDIIAPDVREEVEGAEPDEVAPVLDSEKEDREREDREDDEEAVKPLPTSDQDAQALLPKTELRSLEDEPGRVIDIDELPELQVPGNVRVLKLLSFDASEEGDGDIAFLDRLRVPGQPREVVRFRVAALDASVHNSFLPSGLTPKVVWADDARLLVALAGGIGGAGGSEADNITNAGYVYELDGEAHVTNPGADFDRLYDPKTDAIQYEELGGGRTRETIIRADGTKIVTIRDRFGAIEKRSKTLPDGREYFLAYADEDVNAGDENYAWSDPGDELPRVKAALGVDDYVLDVSGAGADDVEFFLAQPPVEQVQRIYTIDEVKRSARLRDSVRRLEVSDLTFESGSARIARDQISALSSLAEAIAALVEKSPAETFLIEGHTDAVGDEIYNLELSDARATVIAQALTDFYGIPPENLTTQGYGERYLKVRTDDDERANRRVTAKRITALITYVVVADTEPPEADPDAGQK